MDREGGDARGDREGRKARKVEQADGTEETRREWARQGALKGLGRAVPPCPRGWRPSRRPPGALGNPWFGHRCVQCGMVEFNLPVNRGPCCRCQSDDVQGIHVLPAVLTMVCQLA